MLDNQLVLAVCAGVAALVLALGIVAFVLIGVSSDPYGKRILDNTSVAGVDVGGMTTKQAYKAVSSQVGDSYRQNDMILRLPDREFCFTPKDTGVKLDVHAAVKAAYDFGRTGDSQQQQEAYRQSRTDGHVVELLPYMSLNEESIRAVLADYAKDFSGAYTPSGYTLEGEMPELGEKDFDPMAPCQTLVLTTGTSGFTLDMEDVYNRILDAYYHDCFEVDLSDGVTMDDPEPLDLDAIFREVTIDPVEPKINKQTFEITPGSYGCTFDLEAAKKALRNAGPGERYEITMDYVAPQMLGEEVCFQDVLGYALTPHSTNENRNTNLRLACAALDGQVLQPGETISYNELLGQRTTENGYMPAPAYSGTNLVDSVGGGICQVSSTLYLSALFSELEIVDRINHGYPANYIPAGLDATVNWLSPDLKIKNNQPLPVKICAEESDGFVKIKIMGTELRDYVVKMEFRANGHYARTYVCKYDLETGKQISRTEDRISSYISSSLSAVGEIGNGQAYINGNVKTPEFNTEPESKATP